MDLANDKKFYSLLVSFTWYSIRILFLCFLIFGCDHSLNSEKKESDSDDIPVPDPLYLDVEYPNGGEIFDPGSIVPIQWVSNLDTCEWGMRIVLYKGINEEELVHVNTPNTGIFQWYVNTELASGGSYRIWIESLCDKGVYCGGCFGDFSDSVFVLTDNIVEPYLQLLYPNGGEVLIIGSQVDILWESNLGDCSWGMDIILVKGNDSLLSINYGATDTGIYQWQIPSTIETADDYKIFIESLCYGGGSYCDGCHGDESDDSFSVVDN